MLIYLLRHGETAWNAEKRYQGRTDVPLSERGQALLSAADFSPKRVYTSPLRRTAETASILFPEAEQETVPDFRELDFGAFEGRTAGEMADDPDYRAWVEGGCNGRCPGGEDWAAFSRRTCAAFVRLMEHGSDPLVIVAHGGTQMAILERFGRPARPRWEWLGKNGGGFQMECGGTRQSLSFRKKVYWGV